MLYWHYTKVVSHIQCLKVPSLILLLHLSKTFLKILDVRNNAVFCRNPDLMVIPSLSSHVSNLLHTAPSAPTTTGTTSCCLIPHSFQISLFKSWFLSIFSASFSYTLWSHHTIWLLIIPFLTSTQVMLTAERPVDQPGNIVMSSLVLLLCQVLALTNKVIYCFTFLATQPTKWGLHWIVDVELNMVCSQCLFFGCKNWCFSFNFKSASAVHSHVLILLTVLSISRKNWPCIFFSDHQFKVPFCLSCLNSFFPVLPRCSRSLSFSLLPSTCRSNS